MDIGAVEVQPAPIPVFLGPDALPGGNVGAAYSQSLTAFGPPGPFTFDVTGGALPPGLVLGTDGSLTGTPSAVGTFNFIVMATSQSLATGRTAFDLTIAPFVPPPGGGTLAPLTVSGAADGSAVRFAPSGGQYGTTPLATLAPFGTVPAGVRTATGDVNGDGVPDTILATGPGTPIRVAVVSGADNATLLVTPFDPFGGTSRAAGSSPQPTWTATGVRSSPPPRTRAAAPASACSRSPTGPRPCGRTSWASTTRTSAAGRGRRSGT